MNNRSTKLFYRFGWPYMVAFYGLIIVLIIIIVYTPLKMNWWILIISLSIAFALVQLLFNFARKGKIHAKGKSAFDILPKERQEK